MARVTSKRDQKLNNMTDSLLIQDENQMSTHPIGLIE
ncbi:hypothetical protein AT864_02056 [Anoxybacillus sp. P3H1B]|nr:hypothetical protein AT864_02056 [Anoxybacillus sp. P3H1B]